LNRGDGAVDCDRKGESVTVLTTFGPLATKHVRWDPLLTKPVITAYGNAKTFEISEYSVGNLDELAQLLAGIESCPRALIVRGRPAEGIDRKQAFRRLHPRTRSDGTVEPATLQPAARHWIPLVLDSIPCPDSLDPVHEPDWAVEHAVRHLPEEFHGTSCWWALTSGQGFKPGLRMRLFFWADRALAEWELKQWLADSPVDRSIFAPAQPIYIARPIFVGMPDPVPTRSGIWRGDRDVITPPTITKPEVATVREPSDCQSSSTYFDGSHEAHRSRIGGYEGGGYETHRGRIGDHEDGDGFHGPVKAAVAAYIARHGASVETEWLRADLERAIRGAPRDPQKHDDAYVEFRVSDLDTLITAIIKLQVAKEAGGQQRGECEPTYPTPLATVEEAREQLTRVFDDHVASIAAYAEAKAAYQTSLKEWEARQAV
jgi:hypothetical protein